MNSRQQFTLTIGNNINGAPLSVIGYRFSNGNGPAIYIQGGTHGGEVTFLIFKLLNNFLLSNTDWEGTVTLIPISQPISWNQKAYHTTAGKFSFSDGKDWNRSFPGNPDGSIADRCADMIFKEASRHDLVIDLHTSRVSKPFSIISREDLVSHCLKSGILPTYLAPKMTTNLPLPDAIDNFGKKGITIECGSHDTLDQQNSQLCFESILNLMRLEGALKDLIKPKVNQGSFVYSKYFTYFAPMSGFVEFIKPLEKTAKKGEVLYLLHISDNLGETKEIVAEEDCMVMKYQASHIATVGDEVVTVVNLKDIIKKVE